MIGMGMKNKGVAFNLDDPDQKELYKWAVEHTTNFSSYVKRLIQADRDKKNATRIKPGGGGIKFKVE